jgi:5-methylcytosine-specific restriction endonuclease McrA
MEAATERLVRQRAGGRCEYCRLPQEVSPIVFEVDHIVARKHGGADEAENLCLACFYWK